MLKKILFQTHWLLGISAGLVLAIVGVTGGMLSFEREILLLINPQVMRVQIPAQTVLDPQTLLDRVALAEPNKRVSVLTINSDPGLAARVGFARAPDSKIKKGLDWYYINPFTPFTSGLLAKARGEEFFLFVMKLHRWLVLDTVGKQVVGASTCALIFLCISGLYLRWPKSVTNWRKWLCFSFNRSGRSFLWDMHSVVGTWCLVFYLLASLTGLYWSYDWYRSMLFSIAGVARPTAQVSSNKAPTTFSHININPAWSHFLSIAGNYQTATLNLPATEVKPIDITYLPENPKHNRATNKLSFNQQTGALIMQDNYQDRSAGQRFMNSIYALHTGSYFGLTGLILMMLASLMMPLFAITGWLLYLDRLAKKRALKQILATTKKPNERNNERNAPDMLIGYASQTGVAEQLAWHTANLLRATGMIVTVQPLSAINVAQLGHVQRALFVVSTFGEGGPPDSARNFSKLLNPVHVPALTHLRFGLLALGDKHYKTFCQFGRQIEQWLHAHGATSLFNRIDVHQQDPHALELWRENLTQLVTQLAPISDQPLIEEQPFFDWILQTRRCLNASSQGLPTYHLEFKSEQITQWRSGDLMEILLPDNKTIRQYSIASHSSDGAVFLLIRQARNQGQLGVASGYLTCHLPIGTAVRARIKSNTSFHLNASSSSLILIGNGTGLAGLRSHLKARIEQGHHRNWLIFGERNQAHDNYYSEELHTWQKQGWIAQLDLVYSRDPAQPPLEQQTYVQHRLLYYAQKVRVWINDGATILVSGSLEGMASGVDEALREILGDVEVDRLIEQRRYLRDVY